MKNKARIRPDSLILVIFLDLHYHVHFLKFKNLKDWEESTTEINDRLESHIFSILTIAAYILFTM